MRRILSCFLLIAILCIVTACSKLQLQSVETNPYDGTALRIGIIGEMPEVRERQVKFIKINFSELEKERLD